MLQSERVRGDRTDPGVVGHCSVGMPNVSTPDKMYYYPWQNMLFIHPYKAGHRRLILLSWWLQGNCQTVATVFLGCHWCNARWLLRCSGWSLLYDQIAAMVIWLVAMAWGSWWPLGHCKGVAEVVRCYFAIATL